jgi:CDP-glycerol glycerophosphotransferase (TagB/SpsB family)
MLFCSHPDYADNAYALCRYLSRMGYDKKYRFFWMINNEARIPTITQQLRNDQIIATIVKRKSLKGFWFFIRCRYLITTHGCFDNIHLHQHHDKHICLWHGMPLKLIGAMVDGQMPCAPNSDITIATSSYFQKMMSKAFMLPVSKVLVTGQPRCDLLLEPTDWFEKEGIDRSKYRQIGMWMPTFRKSIVGAIRVDGDYQEKRVSFLDFQQLEALDKYLYSVSTLLVIKIHGMDALQNERFPDFNNIRIIYPQTFSSQLYPLLGSCDFLLTDYSSVFIDYQILCRPIVFVMYDIELYKKTRGLSFGDIEKGLPGPILSDYNSLCTFIKSPFMIKSELVFNDYSDDKASERICRILHLN